MLSRKQFYDLCKVVGKLNSLRLCFYSSRLTTDQVFKVWQPSWISSPFHNLWNTFRLGTQFNKKSSRLNGLLLFDQSIKLISLAWFCFTNSILCIINSKYCRFLSLKCKFRVYILIYMNNHQFYWFRRFWNWSLTNELIIFFSVYHKLV
jgi:hypothetical protein